MKNLLTICAVAILLITATVPAQADLVTLVGSPTHLDDENWEYIYDVYTEGAQVQTVRLIGFTGLEVVNSLNQRWDPTAARHGAFSPEMLSPAYPSIESGGSWMVTGADYEMLNTWHTPSEYLGTGMYTGYYCFGGFEGQSDTPIQTIAGKTWAATDGVQWFANLSQGGVTGLVGTLRLVHPLGPSTISYELLDNDENMIASGSITGPVPEPATIGLLGLGSLMLVRRKHRR